MKPKLKKIFTTLLLFILCASFLPGVDAEKVHAQTDISLEAEHAVLLEAHTGEVLYEKNAHENNYPASLTKIMTLAIAMEALENGMVDWEDTVTVSENAWRTGGSQMYLDHNQEVSFRELIKGIAIVSANDACIAVAEHIYGSEASFVDRMNRKADELGLENTSYVNTHGLHSEDHYMSPRDTAVLSHYFISNYPEAAKYQSEKTFTFNDIKQYNRNPLLGSFQGTDGIKTGRTDESGYSLAATAQRDGMRFIAVIMNAEDNEERKKDATALLSHAFNNYELYTVATTGAHTGDARVYEGKQDTVPVRPGHDLEVLIPRGEAENVHTKLNFDLEITAPVKEGEVLGEVEVYLGEELLDIAKVEAAEDVEKLGFWASLWNSVKFFFSGLLQTVWEGITGIFS